MYKFVTDGTQFKVDASEIDIEKCTTLRCNVEGNKIDVSFPKNNNFVHDVNANNAGDVEKENDSDNLQHNEAKETAFYRNDAATKLFLSLYKEKRELVIQRKIKTQKVMWKEISKKMMKKN